jgi:hypothetical protein
VAWADREQLPAITGTPGEEAYGNHSRKRVIEALRGINDKHLAAGVESLMRQETNCQVWISAARAQNRTLEHVAACFGNPALTALVRAYSKPVPSECKRLLEDQAQTFEPYSNINIPGFISTRVKLKSFACGVEATWPPRPSLLFRLHEDVRNPRSQIAPDVRVLRRIRSLLRGAYDSRAQDPWRLPSNIDPSALGMVPPDHLGVHAVH